MDLVTEDQVDWLASQFEGLTTEIERFTPSEWAEKKRYLPPQVTPLPGPYRFNIAPYLREIVDCMGLDSPVREVAMMKGVQICATVGVLENVIGYSIEHVRTAPCMMVTADAELAKLRIESNITPMLVHSGLEHLLKSSDETSNRKTGKTDKKIEWFGGGYLVPFGAQNANKLRSISIQYLLNDEVDGWPTTVGKDGDPVKLVRDRTAAYESSRKILDISTPLVKGQSKIHELYERGDQRKYFVRCLRCEHPQELRWKHVEAETGVVSGITWEMDGDRLIVDSVRYLCQHCGHAHRDADKNKLLSPEYGAAWQPTAEPKVPNVRSYHISALYSPPGMQSWATCVQKWLEAWDTEREVPRDIGKLQVFYNNVLGEPFKPYGASVRFEAVSAHKRDEYRYGQIPNAFAIERCGSPILLLTCAVDVHKDCLKVGVFGWARDRRGFLVEYQTLEGDTEQLDDAGTWGALREIIEHRIWKASDGKSYRIALTLIDSGYNTDHVYNFCAEYQGGVFPIKGQAVSPKSARVPQFSPFRTPSGTEGYGITVDLYKDRWSASLRREWSGQGHQPTGHFNAPCDATDKQLKELTAETKVPKLDKATGKTGYVWHRTAGVANELWDLLVYSNAALDLLAWNFSEIQEFEAIEWLLFWQHCEGGAFFEG
jgi:phage terminase large subunit GpA-like protein